MPVRFKGLSEYQRNFLWKKSYLSESCNSSVGRKYPWAGLRSDQLGITKEPSFISKRRVPYHDPQISKSLEWNGAISESNVVASPEPEAPETPKSQEAEQKDVTQERVHSLEASRVPKRTRSHSADSRAEGASDVENNEGVTNHTPVNENVELEHSTKVLSENVDNGVFHNKSQFVPPFKGNSVIHETEYKRNFKGLSPVKEPKLRNDLRENRNLETVSPERKSNKIDDRLKLEAEMELKDLHQPKRKLTPWKHQRLGDPTSHKTLQKCPSTEPEEKGNIVEEQPQKNTTEKLGVSAPTIPVRRRLAWDTENTSEDVQKQPGEKEEEDDNEEEGDRKTGKQAFMGEQEKLDVREKSKADKMKEGSDSSVSSEKGGRLPTPKLRELGGIQRTHHDLTTPAVGGAVLVSPSKMKPPAPEQRKRMTSQDCLETSKNDFTKKESRAVSLLTSPAAGIKTVDPLPLREDSEDNIHKFAEATLPVSKIPKYPTNPPGQLPSPPHVPSYWHPSRRIQGSLRDPEFQHNVGKARMNNLQLPQHEAFNDEDEDRLSEISARSAASSLRAFQTLARAKKRKENFWGKT
ncbi:nuclear protein MDM1 isoform X3 [Homo sapiens]|uniref:nuclear protein MDM1 isoform X3 n=1 Tax=Homo sapiens TaxID=9606 RepID=UPI001FB11326|nr:nuclear protein MDM1 isoform X3 [Homo sapiens]XP_054228545.1 nuclear protein MDM1 isoform X3 [Homo sapiens]